MNLPIKYESVSLLKDSYHVNNSPLSMSTSTPSPSDPLTPPPSVALAPTNWPGLYDFMVTVPSQSKPGQKDPHFSSSLQKLYINQNRGVTLQVKAKTPDHTYGPLLRATMVYTGSDHCMKPVKVCYQHSHNSSGELITPLSSYILRMSSEDGD